jgi:uncharacterized membrane protein YkvA (DUF1232 family)
MSALANEKTPAEARRPLAAVLNYALDLLDMFPDHYKGLGVADDAMLLRIGARHAVAAGASGADLQLLAEEAGEVEAVVGELMAPLEKYVEQLAERAVRGRTVSQILSDKVAFSTFAADVQRQVGSFQPQAIDSSLSADYHVGELRRMMKAALKKSGLIS